MKHLTVQGRVRADSKTEAFIKAAKMPVHVPLSGKTWNSMPGACAPRGAERVSGRSRRVGPRVG